jgi:hypothetical protein
MLGRAFLVLLLEVAIARADGPAPTDPAAAKWITGLRMHVLPKESGYL